MGVVVQEGEAVAVAGIVVVGQHRIPQAAGLPGDGQGAVAQGDHLAQAAGLEHGGHQEHIRGGIDPVGQGAVHLKAGGQLAGVLPLRPAEQIHIPVLAHAQHHHLSAGVHNGIQHPVHQVQALLPRQPGNHGNEGRFCVFGQVQLPLQRQLVLHLQLHRFGGVVALDHGIGSRVVFLGIDAVQDAHQIPRPGPQQPVQLFAVIGGLDLLGVGGAHGGDLLGVHQARLHEGALAVELQLVRGVHVHAQGDQVLDLADGEQALVL